MLDTWPQLHLLCSAHTIYVGEEKMRNQGTFPVRCLPRDVRRAAETLHLIFTMDSDMIRLLSGSDAVENVPVQYFGTGTRTALSLS